MTSFAVLEFSFSIFSFSIVFYFLVFDFIIFFVLVLVFVNEFVIFTFFTVFVNENHTASDLLLNTYQPSSVSEPHRSAGEKVAQETKHLHDDVRLRVCQQTKQVVTAEGAQHLRPQFLFTTERHVLTPTKHSNQRPTSANIISETYFADDFSSITAST